MITMIVLLIMISVPIGSGKVSDQDIREAFEKRDPLYCDGWNGYGYANLKKNERYQEFRAGCKITEVKVTVDLACCENCDYVICPSTDEPCDTCIRNEFSDNKKSDNWKRDK